MLGYLERELIPVNAESDDCRLQVIRLNSGFLEAELIRTPPPPSQKKDILRVNEFNSALINSSYPPNKVRFAFLQIGERTGSLSFTLKHRFDAFEGIFIGASLIQWFLSLFLLNYLFFL